MKFDDIVKLYESSPRYYTKRQEYRKVYYKDPKRKIIHREDGPAIEWDDGGKEWFVDSHRHREDGPAIEFASGDKYWFKHGKCHREDGPAIVYARGDSYWFLNDQILSPEEVKEHKKKLAIKNEIQGHKNNRIDPGMLEDYL